MPRFWLCLLWFVCLGSTLDFANNHPKDFWEHYCKLASLQNNAIVSGKKLDLSFAGTALQPLPKWGQAGFELGVEGGCGETYCRAILRYPTSYAWQKKF